MRRTIACVVAFSALMAHAAFAEDPVYFADANLKATVEARLYKTDPTPTDMLRLTTLSAQNRGISNLTGLQYATNLTTLDLPNNQISDLDPLEGLTKLTYLSLGLNQISDLSPLAGLTNLTTLSLSYNQISDISLLAGLTKLTGLLLWGNQISGISPLAGLTNLTSLDLGLNQISDLGHVAGLTNLTSLSLGGNQIGDLSPLVGLTNLTNLGLPHNEISNLGPLEGLTNLTSLSLGGNQIGDLGSLAGLTNLTGLWLGANQIGDLGLLRGLTNLTYLTLENNQISDVSPLAGLMNLTTLSLYDNQISDISPLAGLTNLTYLTLQDNPLNQEACDVYIPQIRANNPGIVILYSPCVTQRHTLTISSTGAGSVTTPGEGAFEYDEGVSVPIVATPEGGYHFVNWTGTAVAAGQVANPTAASTTVIVGADYTLVANFAPGETYILTISITPSGGGTVTLSPDEPTYPPDEQVTLTAVPSEGYVFTGWSGDLSGLANPATITMNSNKSITANFETTEQYTLTLTVSPGDGGSVTRSPDKAQYAPGEQVTLTAVPASEYVFSRWSGSITSWVNPVTITMNYNMSITAVFEPAQSEYTLTTDVTPWGGGSVSRSPDEETYSAGEQVTLTATPAAGYMFSRWSGSITSWTNPVTITMNYSMSITAVFEPDGEKPTYTLMISSGTNGDVVVPGEGVFEYEEGTSVPIAARADSGFSFSNWTGTAVSAGKVVNPSSPSTSVLVDADYTLQANFSCCRDNGSIDWASWYEEGGGRCPS